MNKYNTLLNILDQLRNEAPSEYKTYYPLNTEPEKLNHARSKAFIHLFLKVKFGLLNFQVRENFITDGVADGGIDGYYIDNEYKTVFFIQSKFRTTNNNFENKEIKFEEILQMDVERIVAGETQSESGEKYNSKIQKLISNIIKIGDIARWKYEIIILANLSDTKISNLRKLTGGYPCKVINHEKCYEELVFPVVSGTYYKAQDLYISINLINKGSGSKISYSVDTEFKGCTITVVFIPTVEIAQILHKYKNSILKFNPRSYLDMSSYSINREIAKTITDKATNEFALFNNGITMLSDNTDYKEQIGQKDKAQLIVTNPQIINGGQTAYTLSILYAEQIHLNNNKPEKIFENKEVLLKIITFDKEQRGVDEKLKLIESISKATNQQTPVTEADRRSNDKIQIEIQNAIFKEFGYFYERKRGEFGDGIRIKYIDRHLLIDREIFLRICAACDNQASQARRNSERVLFSQEKFSSILNNSKRYREYFFAYKCHETLNHIQKKFDKDTPNKFGIANYGNALRYGKFAVVSVAVSKFDNTLEADKFNQEAENIVNETLSKWLDFEEFVTKQGYNIDYFRHYTDSKSGERRLELNYDGYYKGRTLNSDLKKFFNL